MKIIKQTSKYTEYNGQAHTDDLYFNLNNAEFVEMPMSQQGGLSEYCNRIVASKDSAAIIAIFKEIICKSYGEKSLDGRRFVKSKELTDAFVQTEAYPELFMKLAFDAEAAAAFINGVIPKDLESK